MKEVTIEQPVSLGVEQLVDGALKRHELPDSPETMMPLEQVIKNEILAHATRLFDQSS